MAFDVHGQAVEAPTSAGDPAARRPAERLKALHEEADQLAKRERGLLDQLRQLEVARQIANEELKQADTAAADTGRDIEALDRRMTVLEHERDAERPKVQSRLVEMYKLGRGGYARMLLSTSDFRRLGQASRTVAALAARDEERVRSYERRLKDLAGNRQALASRLRDLTAKRKAAADARAAAARAVANQNALVREIDKRRDLNARLTGELLAAQVKLDAAIRDAGNTQAGAPASAMGAFRGALPWPANGSIARRGGERGAAARDATLAAQRPGIEIQAAEGTSVQAVHEGTVAYAGSFEGFGNLVIIDHGGQSFSLYGHLLEIAVGRGVHVQERQPLGTVGVSPTGEPSLYFELRVNGRPVDPLPWLERSR
jgi:septal ring factor EnvC (AmiA/AmiB activator)